MATMKIAAAVLAVTLASGSAGAQQRVGVHGPMDHSMAQPSQPVMRTPPLSNRRPMPHLAPDRQRATPHPARWGQTIDGHWWGGVRAPGGWSAYHRPYRGYILPSYWVAPGWSVADWNRYDLPEPPEGYGWSRYYDDAVLIDDRGSVYDTVPGVDWSRGDDGFAADRDYADRDYGNDHDQSFYVQHVPGTSYGRPDDHRGERRDNGLGGAAVGAVAGGVAGNLIAGRGNRLGGTLIGAGVGAAAGYAIDRNEDRDRRGPPPGAGYRGPGADYPPPGYPDGCRGPCGPEPIPGPGRFPPPTVIHSGGGTTVTTTTSGGYPSGTVVNGYYYPPATVTTVTIASAPVVTTTTEMFEDTVTYTKPVVHKSYHKPTYHPPSKLVPRCNCR